MTAEAKMEARLKATAAVRALVGERVYAATVPHTGPMPIVTYHRISTVRAQSLRGSTGLADPRIQVDCWADTYPTAKAVATEVRKSLDGFSDGGVFSLIVSERDLPEPDLSRHRVSMDFSWWHEED